MQDRNVQGFRLSPQQRHVWRYQLRDGPATYKVQAALLLEGRLDSDALQNALKQVVERHEILRTCLQSLPGMAMPVQVITNEGNVSLTHCSLDMLDHEEQERKIKTLFDDAQQLSFNAGEPPLTRVSLAKLSPERAILVLTLPALCADSATINNLVREIGNSYAAYFGTGEIDGEPLQYADLAEWQNDLLEQNDGNGNIEYWRKQNIHDALLSDLPFAVRTVDETKFEPQVLVLQLDPKLVGKIDRLVEETGVSESHFFLTCWQTLLWRLNGQDDFVLGIGYDGRSYEELKDAIGLFAKDLPLWCRVDREYQFSQLLKHNETAIGDIIEKQEYFSWEKIVVPEEGGADVGFFPVCFYYEHQDVAVSAAGLRFSIYQCYACTHRFKLKLNCVRRNRGIAVELHYDPINFQRDDIKRLAQQFQLLATNAVATPNAGIGELEILDDNERKRLLVEFNQTHADYPKDKQIHTLIAEQARRNPTGLAILSNDGALSYAELEARANQLAHYLQKHGVGPETLVGLCVERSLNMLVGILGVLKAGGAYVPLDPAYPEDRLTFLLQDTQAPVILTQTKLSERLIKHNARVISLDSDWGSIASQSKLRPGNATGSENLAYLIYTSGSTGKPKGVEITHRNLVNSTWARFDYYGESPRRFGLLSSFAFDSSVAGIFWTLCTGGTLVLPPEGLERDVDGISTLVAQHRISHLLALPSLYSLLLSEGQPEQLEPLRMVIVAGEECPIGLVKSHYKLLPHAALHNEYGPTEGTVWSTVYECRAGGAQRRLPIGRPINNVHVYLLDSLMRPVPIGMPGELHIGGAGVARGYLNRPELTAEKFIANPFSEEGTSRLYKTGDLARYLANGDIEFLGRIDDQVKIRGYRIELGEITAVLGQHPAVQESVVVAREGVNGKLQRTGQSSSDDTGELLSRMLSLGEESAEQLLADIENLSEDDVEEMLTNTM